MEPTSLPAKIDSLEDAASWIHSHDGRIDAWWQQQHALNKDHSLRFQALEKRIASVENRVIWAAGLGAGLGALVMNGMVRFAAGSG